MYQDKYDKLQQKVDELEKLRRIVRYKMTDPDNLRSKYAPLLLGSAAVMGQSALVTAGVIGGGASVMAGAVFGPLGVAIGLGAAAVMLGVSALASPPPRQVTEEHAIAKDLASIDQVLEECKAEIGRLPRYTYRTSANSR